MTDDSQEWELAAQGIATSFEESAEGPLREVNGAQDTLQLMDDIGSGNGGAAPIVLVHEAGGTTVGPLLEAIGGVVSTTGTLGAHLALLAKEYGCPCVLGAQWQLPLEGVARVKLSPDGAVWAIRESSDS